MPMSIVFPTSNHRTCALGEPLRARPCRCPHPWVHDGGCELCGHWLAGTIDVTWVEQAKRLRGGMWAGVTPRVDSRRRLELVG